jgi:hypothetical protein
MLQVVKPCEIAETGIFNYNVADEVDAFHHGAGGGAIHECPARPLYSIVQGLFPS